MIPFDNHDKAGNILHNSIKISKCQIWQLQMVSVSAQPIDIAFLQKAFVQKIA